MWGEVGGLDPPLSESRTWCFGETRIRRIIEIINSDVSNSRKNGRTAAAPVGTLANRYAPPDTLAKYAYPHEIFSQGIIFSFENGENHMHD